MKVKYKDMDKKIHRQRVAFQMVGLNVDYPSTELIVKCIEVTKKRGGDFSLDEATEIQFKHNLKWEEYFEKIESEKTKASNDAKK